MTTVKDAKRAEVLDTGTLFPKEPNVALSGVADQSPYAVMRDLCRLEVEGIFSGFSLRLIFLETELSKLNIQINRARSTAELYRKDSAERKNLGV